MVQILYTCDICKKQLIKTKYEEVPEGWALLNAREWQYNICPSCLSEIDWKMKDMKMEKRV